MSEPTGPARDSSLRDRKAPGVCIRRTPQPRLRNVMVRTARRYHYSPSILRLETQSAALWRLPSRKCGKECADVLDRQLMFAPNRDQV